MIYDLQCIYSVLDILSSFEVLVGRFECKDSEILKEDDSHWPAPDRIGRQELEVVCGKERIRRVRMDGSGSDWVGRTGEQMRYNAMPVVFSVICL